MLKALEAQQAEEQRQLDELQRRQAAANLQDNPNPGVGADAAAAEAEASGDLSTQGATSGVSAAAGSVAGGRTGGGGGGTNPRGSGIGYIDAILCPIVGPSAFGDTWGAPRSGGRRHQGVDMLAPTGTPVAGCRVGLRRAPRQRARRCHPVVARRQRQPLLLRPSLGLRGRSRPGRTDRRHRLRRRHRERDRRSRICTSRSARTTGSR